MGPGNLNSLRTSAFRNSWYAGIRPPVLLGAAFRVPRRAPPPAIGAERRALLICGLPPRPGAVRRLHRRLRGNGGRLRPVGYFRLPAGGYLALAQPQAADAGQPTRYRHYVGYSTQPEAYLRLTRVLSTMTWALGLPQVPPRTGAGSPGGRLEARPLCGGSTRDRQAPG